MWGAPGRAVAGPGQETRWPSAAALARAAGGTGPVSFRGTRGRRERGRRRRTCGTFRGPRGTTTPASNGRRVRLWTDGRGFQAQRGKCPRPALWARGGKAGGRICAIDSLRGRWNPYRTKQEHMAGRQSLPRAPGSLHTVSAVRIEALRETIAHLESEGVADMPAPPAPLGVAGLDAALGGGLARGALHEIRSAPAEAPSAFGFALALAALPGAVAAAAPRHPAACRGRVGQALRAGPLRLRPRSRPHPLRRGGPAVGRAVGVRGGPRLRRARRRHPRGRRQPEGARPDRHAAALPAGRAQRRRGPSRPPRRGGRGERGGHALARLAGARAVEVRLRPFPALLAPRARAQPRRPGRRLVPELEVRCQILRIPRAAISR